MRVPKHHGDKATLSAFALSGILVLAGVYPNMGWGLACEKELALLSGLAAPAAPPKPQPIPTKPAPNQPKPEPSTPHPRRSVPLPAPEKPKIPAKPVEDPKDIQPEDLYSTDSNLRGFWNELPIGLRRLMVEEMRAEREKLQSHMEARYGGSSPEVLVRKVVELQGEIESIESQHKSEVLAVIQEMIGSRFGNSVDGLKISISTSLPQAVGNQNRGDGRMIPELPSGWDAGLIHRTELRNLWQQGEGWIGMKEFAYGYKDKLNAISPGLAEKYQELDRLYRYGQIAQLDLVPIVEHVDSLPREVISAGREIVTTDFEIVDFADGSQSVQVKEGGVHGIAVGRNGWAAAHEARKAAAQMATPLEAAHRWMLGSERRAQLDKATNSSRAEIRQGVFGPAVVIAMRKRLAFLYSQGKTNQIEDADYYYMVEGLFSLPPAQFQHASKLLFHSEFEKSPDRQKEAEDFFELNGIFPANFRSGD